MQSVAFLDGLPKLEGKQMSVFTQLRKINSFYATNTGSLCIAVAIDTQKSPK